MGNIMQKAATSSACAPKPGRDVVWKKTSLKFVGNMKIKF